MADVSDVEMAIVNALTAAIYPSGASSPSSIVLTGGRNPNCRIRSGWPLPVDVDRDVIAGNPPGSASVVNIGVFTQTGMEKDVSRYPQKWVDQFRGTATLTTAVAVSTITLGGSVTAGQYLTVIVNHQPFSYGMQTIDNPSTVARIMASMINAQFSAYASGPTITVIGRTDIIARVGAPGTVVRELERSNQRFIVTIWAANNDARVATARIVRSAMAAITFLDLPDTSRGRLRYEMSNDVDRISKQNVSCRDIFYWVEYPTTQVAPGYPITAPVSQINASDGTPTGVTQSFTS